MSRAGWFMKTTAMIVVVTLLSRLLGMLRQVFLAGQFGLGIETDAYYFAFNIPNILFLVTPGALNAVLVPTLKAYISNEHLLVRQRLFHQVMTWVACFFLLLTVIGMVAAPQIVQWIAPSFSPEKQAFDSGSIASHDAISFFHWYGSRTRKFS